MEPSIPEFGTPVAGAEYTLRPGGYVVLLNRAGAVAVVVTPAGCYLPGGGQEAGESPEAAAVREVEEECALWIFLGDTLGVADELAFAADEGRHYRKRGKFFLAEPVCRSRPGEPEHVLRWLPPHEALAALGHASQRWAVEAACRRKGGWRPPAIDAPVASHEPRPGAFPGRLHGGPWDGKVVWVDRPDAPFVWVNGPRHGDHRVWVTHLYQCRGGGYEFVRTDVVSIAGLFSDGQLAGGSGP